MATTRAAKPCPMTSLSLPSFAASHLSPVLGHHLWSHHPESELGQSLYPHHLCNQATASTIETWAVGSHCVYVSVVARDTVWGSILLLVFPCAHPVGRVSVSPREWCCRCVFRSSASDPCRIFSYRTDPCHQSCRPTQVDYGVAQSTGCGSRRSWLGSPNNAA